MLPVSFPAEVQSSGFVGDRPDETTIDRLVPEDRLILKRGPPDTPAAAVAEKFNGVTGRVDGNRTVCS